MRFQRPIRLPVQVGTTALWSLALSSGILLPSVAALGATLWVGGAFLIARGFFVVWHLDVALLVALALEGSAIAWSARHLRLAWRDRPSDVVIGAGGLRFEGGRLGGRAIPWSDLLGARAELACDDEGLWQLRVALSPPAIKHEQPLILGEAELDDERRSLEALLESIRAAAAPATPGQAPPGTPTINDGAINDRAGAAHPDLLVCGACHAPAVLDDRPELTCAACGAAIVVPARLRERLREERGFAKDQRAATALVGELLDQPGARVTNVLYALAALPTALAWVVAMTLAVLLARHHALEFSNAFLLTLFAVGTIFACFCFVRVRLANRVALRLLALDFGARPPAAAAAPYTCRECGAPLLARDGELLVRCIYCKAENVIGIDLRPQRDAGARQRGSLAETFGARARERRFWQRRALIALCALPISAWALQHGRRPISERARLEVACSGGVLDDCVRLGRLFQRGAGVDIDDAEAARIFQRACERHGLAACVALGEARAVGRGVERDPAAARELHRRACDGGFAPGCTREGELYAAGDGVAKDPALAVRLYQQACSAGEPHGCGRLADHTERGDGVAQSFAEAARLYEIACTQRDAWACARLGKLYGDGHGPSGAADDATALGYLERACEAPENNWLGCHYLGEAYVGGKGVARDDNKAFSLFASACNYGNLGEACVYVGRFEEADEKRPRSEPEFYYGIACYHGALDGCVYQGLLRQKLGKLGPAYQRFEQACVGGDGWGCDEQARALRKGIGVAVDRAAAMRTFSRGCELGYRASCLARDSMAASDGPR